MAGGKGTWGEQETQQLPTRNGTIIDCTFSHPSLGASGCAQCGAGEAEAGGSLETEQDTSCQLTPTSGKEAGSAGPQRKFPPSVGPDSLRTAPGAVAVPGVPGRHWTQQRGHLLLQPAEIRAVLSPGF